MEYIRRKSLIFTICFAVALVLVVLGVLILTVVNITHTGNVIDEDARKYVSEIASQANTSLKSRVNSNLVGLNSTSTILSYFDETEGLDSALVREFLQDATDSKGYETLLLFDAAGNYITGAQRSRGFLSFDKDDPETVSSLPFFKTAAQGSENAQIIDFEPEEATGSLVYSVPFYWQDSLYGVLMAISDKSQMRSFLNVELFDGVGLVHIVTKTGDFLVISEKREPILDTSNVFEYFEMHADFEGPSFEQLRRDMLSGGEVQFYFTLEDGVRKVAVASPISVEGASWYLFCVMPTNVTTDRMQYLLTQTIAVSTILVTLFMLFAILLFVVHMRGQAKLQELAFVDRVTGGMSLARFEMEYRRLIDGAKPSDYVLVSMDVDKFKLINDFFGSDAGNKTLAFILRCMERSIESDELASRTAADKFSLLFRFKDTGTLLERIDGIAAKINGFNETVEDKYYLSFSVGA